MRLSVRLPVTLSVRLSYLVVELSWGPDHEVAELLPGDVQLPLHLQGGKGEGAVGEANLTPSYSITFLTHTP